MSNILISEFMDDAAVEKLSSQHTVEYLPRLVDDTEQLLNKVENIDALIVRNRTQVNRELLAKAPKLQVVGRLGVGLDNIDLNECTSKSIEVIPAIGANANSVAEYVICTATILLRGAYLSTAQVAAGSWPRPALSSGREVKDKVMGLIGFGSIGQVTAQLAQAVGMNVIAHDPQLESDHPIWQQSGVKKQSLDEVIQQADVVSLHIPLVEQTRNLLNKEKMQSMKKGAIVINSSRGGIVDEAELVALLQQGHLGGAALDVFADEPLKANSLPTDCPGLLLTPHIAGVSHESNIRVSEMIAEKVNTFLIEGK